MTLPPPDPAERASASGRGHALRFVRDSEGEWLVCDCGREAGRQPCWTAGFRGTTLAVRHLIDAAELPPPDPDNWWPSIKRYGDHLTADADRRRRDREWAQHELDGDTDG
jgi:hypothetical protein